MVSFSKWIETAIEMASFSIQRIYFCPWIHGLFTVVDHPQSAGCWNRRLCWWRSFVVVIPYSVVERICFYNSRSFHFSRRMEPIGIYNELITATLMRTLFISFFRTQTSHRPCVIGVVCTNKDSQIPNIFTLRYSRHWRMKFVGRFSD